MQSVKAHIESITIPTYGLGQPEKNPLFFEKRVYQGSCGKVYPLPFIDKVYQDDPPRDQAYQSVNLENEFIRLVMLPEIGGRIFLGQDKANRDYDFFYRQDVIKPALVGLAGPWISGGVEFNWPQHHRPGTYLPADVKVVNENDGATTVWLSEHDPLNRLKGMHGIRLRPGSSLIELEGRLYNRTPLTQTFLWWANVAARVHDNYQSFFPPDVHYVADHAVRAMSSFPIAEGCYYGVDYASRTGANDLSWYRNIPVPTSYMVCQTDFSFFGGYDFDEQGGFVHVANPHISPGKKQWTWGNHEFGWAWDRELTDHNGPYVELMAGVYTDNQPDFSYLLPYETKTFSQYWWPYREIGPVQEANTLAALRLVVNDEREIEIGLAVSQPMEALTLILKDEDRVLLQTVVSASPEKPWKGQNLRFEGENPSSLCLWVFDASGKAVIGYRPVDASEKIQKREVATEPPMPEAIANHETLYLTGEHLELNRHPTRYPESYWEECLRRDPQDVRCNIALGRKRLWQGCFEKAVSHFSTAIQRLTHRHPNPETGQAHYFLGLALRLQNQLKEAYTAYYKATWNYEWRSAAYFELGCIDMRNQGWSQALQHFVLSLQTNASHNKSTVAAAICHRQQEAIAPALRLIEDLLATDPLDHWAMAEKSRLQTGAARLSPESRNDAQTALDVAFDYINCAQFDDAISILEQHLSDETIAVAVPNPMERTQLTHYVLAWCFAQQGQAELSSQILKKVASASPDYCFPSRIEEQLILEWAMQQNPYDRIAAYGLGNYFYDRKRHKDAIHAWETACRTDPQIATVHRNLGIAYWNVHRNGEASRKAYQAALSCDPDDARLIVEFCQLCEKLGDAPESRLRFLESNHLRVQERDDACVELVTLYNLTGQPQKVIDLLTARSFHPWEGGEGKVLRQYTTARILLGVESLEQGQSEQALEQFEKALKTPDRLGEKYHLLQAKADVLYWQAKALQSAGRTSEAKHRFEAAAAESGDFQQMAVTQYSVLTFYKALAFRELGQKSAAVELCQRMIGYVDIERKKPARIDYFATSLPHLLVFEEDIQQARDKELLLLKAYAFLGLGDVENAAAFYQDSLALGSPDVSSIHLRSELMRVRSC